MCGTWESGPPNSWQGREHDCPEPLREAVSLPAHPEVDTEAEVTSCGVWFPTKGEPSLGSPHTSCSAGFIF